MIRIACLAVGLITLPVAAMADDAADCDAGIAMIRTELAKEPTETIRAKLDKALTDAEREAKEREYDECLEAVEDAKEVLKK
jgi:hypothetical protein